MQLFLYTEAAFLKIAVYTENAQNDICTKQTTSTRDQEEYDTI
jgi:hypothetical protein